MHVHTLTHGPRLYVTPFQTADEGGRLLEGWDGRVADQPQIDLMLQDVTHSAEPPKSLPGSECAPTEPKKYIYINPTSILDFFLSQHNILFHLPPVPVYKNIPLKTALILPLELNLVRYGGWGGSSEWSCKHWSKKCLLNFNQNTWQKWQFTFYSGS